MVGKPEKSIVIYCKKEENPDNLLKSAINNNHLLLNQLMLSLKVPKKIPSFLSNLSRANITLPPESF